MRVCAVFGLANKECNLAANFSALFQLFQHLRGATAQKLLMKLCDLSCDNDGTVRSQRFHYIPQCLDYAMWRVVKDLGSRRFQECLQSGPACSIFGRKKSAKAKLVSG